MAHSRFLPDPTRLASLLAGAGLGDASNSAAPARPPVTAPRAPSPAARLPVPAVEPSRASVRPPTAPTSHAPPPVAPPPVAPVAPPRSDAQLAASLFGGRPFESRLDALVKWLKDLAGATGVFVADAEGLPLASLNVPEGYVAAVGPLWKAQQEVSKYVMAPAAGSIVLELAAHALLQVVWVDGPTGRLGVALVVTAALPAPMLERIRQITLMAIRAEEG